MNGNCLRRARGIPSPPLSISAGSGHLGAGALETLACLCPSQKAGSPRAGLQPLRILLQGGGAALQRAPAPCFLGFLHSVSGSRRRSRSYHSDRNMYISAPSAHRGPSCIKADSARTPQTRVPSSMVTTAQQKGPGSCSATLSSALPKSPRGPVLVGKVLKATQPIPTGRTWVIQVYASQKHKATEVDRLDGWPKDWAGGRGPVEMAHAHG